MKNYVGWAFILGIFFGLVVGWSIGIMRAHVKEPQLIVAHQSRPAFYNPAEKDIKELLEWKQ